MRTLLTLCVCFCLFASFASAQESLQDIFKRKVKERAEQKKNEGVDAGLDAAEEGAKDAVKGATTKKKSKKEKKEEEEAVEEEENAEEGEEAEESEQAESSAKAAKPTFASYSKYDFVPGDQVILYEDFPQVETGDFPGTWDTQGSGEVVTLSTAPGKWLKTTNRSAYILPVKSALPENFTLEFDMVFVNHDGSMHYYWDFIDGLSADEAIDALVAGKGGFRVDGTRYTAAYTQWKDQQWGNIQNSVDIKDLAEANGTPAHVSIWVQKQRVRVYLNQNKVFDVAKLAPAGLKFDKVRLSTDVDTDEFYVSNIRLAVGAPDMRSKLITEGKLVTHGILFDSGSDKIRPESYGTLKSIAGVLKENASVKVKIIGHTDTDGNEKGNLELSKRRAESVKNTLAKEFGIEAGRMTTDGKGQSQPVSPNTTSEGKANNRRVEFVKI